MASTSETRETPGFWQTFWKYRGLFLKYRWMTALGVVALLVVNILGALIPREIKASIDALQGIETVKLATGLEPLHYHLWVIVGLAVAMFIARVLSRMWLLGAGGLVEVDLRHRLFSHLLAMPPSFYAKTPTGQVMSRMTNDVESLRMLMGGSVMLGFNTIFTYLTCLPMMWALSSKLTMIAFVLYPFCIWGANVLAHRVKNLYYGVQTVLGDISAVVQENFTGMAVLQAYHKEEDENRRLQIESDRYFDTYDKLIDTRVWMMMVFLMLGGVSTLLVLLFGGQSVMEKTMTLGGFIAFTLYLERITWPTASLGWTLSTIQQGAAALERMDDVLSETPEIQNSANVIVPKMPLKGNLALSHVSFAYDTKKVLDDIDLTISAGETIAIVGPIGSGKSTLLKLIPRLLNIAPGEIYLDGIDITQLELATLRSNVVYMAQQSFLFSDRVADNIAYGQPEKRQDLETHVIPAARTAQMHSEIEKFAQGYDTLVGERGILLSGGQRQRVSLARTLMSVADVPVILLDDPFSNVDADTERRIIDALLKERIFKHKTTLFATHRFSLVQHADRVVLLDGGRIQAIGTHAELLKKNALYNRLNQTQALKEILGEEPVE